MPLTLLAMRHAKSDWSADFATDLERPLNRRGVRAAATMGRWLTSIGEVPDAIVSSPAVRALTTAELAAEAGKWGVTPVVDSRLYDDSVDGVISAIREGGDLGSRVLVAGHLPTWPMLVATLTGGQSAHMPTAAVACLRVRCSEWRELGAGAADLEWLMTPKRIQRGEG